MGRRERREEKRKKRNLIISLFFIFLMVFGFSLAGVIVNNPNPGAGGNEAGSQNMEYNGVDFETRNDYYITEIDGQEKEFLFFPTSTETIRMEEGAVQALQGADVVTITFDPESPDVQSQELARFQMSKNLDKTIYNAVTQNSSQYSFSVVTCDSATPQNPVVYLNTSNATRISYDNGCVTVNGRQVDMLRATERLIFGVLGVIE